MPEPYEVVWAQVAEEDLIEIAEFIANENISAAKRFMKTIEEKAQSLAYFPKRGRVIPELQKFGISIYRELLVKAWRIVYRIENHTVYILGVFDGRRSLEDIILERVLRS